jgi:spore coat protein JB
MIKLPESDSQQLLGDLQAIDFALVDITLYLDTHPDDAKELAQHIELSEKRQDIRHQLEILVGPQNAFGIGDKESWLWSQGPWPWQI